MVALVVIDAQQEYFAPAGKVVLPGGPAAVGRIADALAWARAQGLPVVHVVHESRKPGAAIFAPVSRSRTTPQNTTTAPDAETTEAKPFTAHAREIVPFARR